MGRAVGWAVFIGMVLVAMSISPLATYGQGTIAVDGRVVNGTAGANIPSDLTISLGVIQAGSSVEARDTVADAGGTFSFGEVDSGEDFTYVIGTEYAGASYRVQVELSMLQEPVELLVYESTSSREAIHVNGHTLVVNAADSRSQQVSSLELVALENTGDRTFVPDIAKDGPMSLLRFSLPEGAAALDVQSSLVGGGVLQVDVGFAMTTPVPPGIHEIIYTYRFPYNGSKKSFSHSFPFGAETFRVLVLDGVGQARGPGLELMEPFVLGDDRYVRLETHDLVAGADLEIELFGLPRPSLWQQLVDAISGEDFARLVIPGTFSLALIALLSYALVRNRRPAMALQGALHLGPRSDLLEAMAHMDDRFQRGEFEEEDYLRERQELKERILRLEGVLPSVDASDAFVEQGSVPAPGDEEEREV